MTAERWHGTTNGYCNRRCRCQPCRTAWATYNRAREAQRKKALVEIGGRMVHPDVEHGRVSSYGNWGCRCKPCTDAWTADCVARNRRNKERA